MPPNAPSWTHELDGIPAVGQVCLLPADAKARASAMTDLTTEIKCPDEALIHPVVVLSEPADDGQVFFVNATSFPNRASFNEQAKKDHGKYMELNNAYTQDGSKGVDMSRVLYFKDDMGRMKKHSFVRLERYNLPWHVLKKWRVPRAPHFHLMKPESLKRLEKGVDEYAAAVAEREKQNLQKTKEKVVDKDGWEKPSKTSRQPEVKKVTAVVTDSAAVRAVTNAFELLSTSEDE